MIVKYHLLEFKLISKLTFLTAGTPQIQVFPSLSKTGRQMERYMYFPIKSILEPFYFYFKHRHTFSRQSFLRFFLYTTTYCILLSTDISIILKIVSQAYFIPKQDIQFAHQFNHMTTHISMLSQNYYLLHAFCLFSPSNHEKHNKTQNQVPF